MDKKKYSVSMEPKLFAKIEALKDSEHKSMNVIFVECIESGLERLYGDQQIITKPSKNPDGTKTIEIPADIVEAARHAVNNIEAAVDGQLVIWLLEGKTVNTSYKKALGQEPNMPQLNGNTTPAEAVQVKPKPSRFKNPFKR